MDDVFEVQTLKDGRWMIERRFRDMQEAIGEAHGLFERGTFKCVKVIKEVFDQQAEHREMIIYRLPWATGR